MFLNQLRYCYRVNRDCLHILRAAINGQSSAVKRWNCDNNNKIRDDAKVQSHQMPELTPMHKLVEKIQNAQSTAEVLNLIPIESSNLVEDQIMSIYRSIEKMQKNETTSISRDILLNNNHFKSFNLQLKNNQHRFSEKHLLELIYIDNSLGLTKYGHFDFVYYRLLKLVNRCQLNNINQKQINDLYCIERALRRSKSIDVWSEMIKTMPLTLNEDELNVKNLPPQKMEEHCIAYKSYELPFAMQKPEMNREFLDSFDFKLAKDKLDVHFVCKIIRAIEHLHEIPNCYNNLWRNCLEIFEEYSHELVPMQLSGAIRSIANIYTKNPDLVNVNILSNASTEVWLSDFPLDVTIELIQSFDKCNYADVTLFRHLNEILQRNFLTLIHLPPYELFNVVSAFACANIFPNNMETKVWSSIKKNDAFRCWRQNLHWPWIQFIINLAVLNCTDEIITRDAIQRAILQTYATTNPKASLYADVLKLYQIYHDNVPLIKLTKLDNDVESFVEKAKQINAEYEFAELPLTELLKEAVDDEYIWNKVVTKHGHCIQHLLIQNVQTDQFMKFEANRFNRNAGNRTENGYTSLDDIILNEYERFLAINQMPDKLIKLNKQELRGQSALQQKQLENLGLKVLFCPIMPTSDAKQLISQFLNKK